MKTTLELPDELMRAVKIRAASEGRRLKELMAELIRRGLADESQGEEHSGRRITFPLIDCPPAHPGEELTPDLVAAILAEDDARNAGYPL